jgi:hypothetical protein
MVMAALGVLGVLLCGMSPAWGARGYHRMALASIGLGAILALAAAIVVVP